MDQHSVKGWRVQDVTLKRIEQFRAELLGKEISLALSNIAQINQ
jgi:hypothetical protein